MAKAPGAFVKYGLGFLNPRAGEGRELTVRQMLEEAASDIDFIFGDQPTAEAGARALLGDVYYSLLEPDASLEQYDRAIEIIAAEAAGKDGAYTPWHDVLIGFLNSRQIVGISAGEEGSDKMYALRDRIYETGFVILRHHEPELVEALKRVAEIASNNTAPAADEWISLIEGLEQRCDRLDPPMNHRTLQAVAIIVGIAATHLHNHFDLPDRNVAWWFIYNRLDGSPFDHARTQTMMLWLIVR